MKPIALSVIPSIYSTRSTSLNASFEEKQILLGIVKNPDGKVYFEMQQPNKGQPARTVEVSLHVFFGGVITEILHAEDFTTNRPVADWILTSTEFPCHLFEGLEKGSVKVAARFIS